MNTMVTLGLNQVMAACDFVADMIIRDLPEETPILIFGVPRGGLVPASLVTVALNKKGREATVTDILGVADVVVDDLIDSGATARRFQDLPFYACYSKCNDPRAAIEMRGWLVFPWEQAESAGADDVVIRFLQFIGEDPQRGGLRETPTRVINAWGEWFGGYGVDPCSLLKSFDDGADKVNELVLVKDIPIYSHCEHHIAPFFGVAHVGYIPNGKIVGLSKIARAVDALARRLQVQERLTNQVADAILEGLNPLGIGVVLECRHMCMESRGISKSGVATTTSAMRGALFDKPAARAEFFSLIRS